MTKLSVEQSLHLKLLFISQLKIEFIMPTYKAYYYMVIEIHKDIADINSNRREQVKLLLSEYKQKILFLSYF